MSMTPPAALLPPGLHDALPPEAEHEAETIARLMAVFAQHGYEPVKPPLIEFEASLLEGPGASKAAEMFRLVDPLSHHPLGVRCDITPQIARIAATRLKDVARPLRLSYTGEILRVRGSQLRPERAFAQVGVELIGSAALAADAEVVLLAIAAVEQLGIGGLSVDVTMPALVPAVCHALGLDAAATQR
ncbi:MAG: ATP phosphoribosyltransferase regulatory subunit, partial [Alphaproteobacteria bacterium]|nr:ATP phosphoribosyltransferase regulatory subunit [Alphaproteobacteria bacterium]